MAKISTGIIGLGNIGYKYDLGKKSILTHAKAIKSSKYFYIKTAVDKNKSVLKKFKKTFKCNTYSSINNALKNDKPEFLIISTGISSISKIFKNVISNKSIKIIMIEKPGANNAKELLKMIQLAKKNKKYLFINYFRLFNPQLDLFKTKIRNSKNFRIVFFYCRGMYNNTSHLISLLLSIFKNPKNISVIKKNHDRKDINPDFRIRFNKGDVTFLSSNVKNLSYLKLISISDKEKIISNNSFNDFIFSNSQNDKFIKNHITYSKNYKLLKIDYSKSQKIVYDNITKFKNKTKYNQQINIYLKTLKILDKIKKLNRIKK